MWRRLVAISSFALATGLGLTSLTEPSASPPASAASIDPPSGLAGQRVLVEQLQVATRVRREEQADAEQRRRRPSRPTPSGPAPRLPPAPRLAARAAAAARATRASPARASVVGARRLEGARRAVPVGHRCGRADRVVRVARQSQRPKPQWRGGAVPDPGRPHGPGGQRGASAYDMYRTRGWQPWSSSRSCWA